MAKKPTAKKKAAPRKQKPNPKFPPRFSTKDVLIRGVDYLPLGDDTDNPPETRS